MLELKEKMHFKQKTLFYYSFIIIIDCINYSILIKKIFHFKLTRKKKFQQTTTPSQKI